MFMTKDLDARGPSGRTEQIIPKIREAFGDDMTLYSDANGYYPALGPHRPRIAEKRLSKVLL